MKARKEDGKEKKAKGMKPEKKKNMKKQECNPGGIRFGIERK